MPSVQRGFTVKELLADLAEGKTAKEVDERTSRRSGATEDARRRMYVNIGVKNASHAVAWGFRNGYLT